MSRARFLLALPIVLATGCSEDRRAGNSSETENNIAARAISVDSVLPDWNRPHGVPTIATLKLDSTNFAFDEVDSTGTEVDVQTEAGIPIPFNKVFWDKAARRARLQVRLDTNLLDRRTRFLIRWKMDSKERSNPGAVWSGIPDSQRLALTSVLVDDFERGTMQNLLPIPQVWYMGGSDLGRIASFTIGAAGANRSGNALGIEYSANAALGQYALMGTALGPGVYNLRSLDSIVFYARGSGTFHPSLDRWTNGMGYKARVKVPIDSTWRRVRIRPKDFETSIDISGNIGWRYIRDSVTNLTFMVAGGSELWVDDVRFYGIDRGDLR